MQVKQQYLNRDDREVDVLEALAERTDEGMTVFEIRTRVNLDIDQLETVLANLNRDNLIETIDEENRTRVLVVEDVLEQTTQNENESFVDRIREKFSL